MAAGVSFYFCPGDIRQSTAVDQQSLPGLPASLENKCWAVDSGRGAIPDYPVDNCPKLVLRPVSWSPTPLSAAAHPARPARAWVWPGSSGGFGRGCFIYIIDR